jgi:spore coat protein CotH
MPEGFQPPAGRQGFPGAQPGMSQASSGEVKIPFLVKFDEYISGQTYQGYERIALRTYGITPDEAMLEEPVTNDMARLAGLPATQTAFAGLQLNQDEAQLYVVSEIIDEDYLAKTFDNPEGVLYKAEVGSTLSYQGDDPSTYANDFSQETRLNDADLAPLIAFMRFLDQSDDATFERELPEYLDVESFAIYLALNALLVNTDSIIGMNNNYYLYYDDTVERFTLLMWDANESLGGLGGQNSVSYDLSLSGDQGFRGPGGGDNVLMERFLANDTFRALYEQKLAEVYEKIFVSGAIVEDAERYAALIHAVNGELELVETEAYDQAVQNLLDFISGRMEYLKTTELLGE